MGQFTHNGVTYEDLGNGKVRVVATPSPAFADPRLQYQVRSAQGEAAAAPLKAPQISADIGHTQAETSTANAGLPYVAPKAAGEARKAEADATLAERRASGIDLDASARAKAIQQFNYAKQLQDVIDHLNQLFIAGPGSTSGIEGLKDFLPSPANKNFDTTSNAARGIVGQTLGFTGGQLNTPQESEKAVGPYLPQSSDFDSTIQQKIQTLQELAKSGQANAIQTLGGVPDANGNIVPVSPAASNPLPPVTPPGGDQAGLATGKTRDVIDPILQTTGHQVGKMLSSGVPDAKIIDFLQKSGVNPADTSIQQALQFRQTQDFKRWQRANPGQAYPIGPAFYTKQVPMSDARSLLNKAAAGDLTGAAVAAPVASANALTGGYLNDLTANPQMAQTGMDLLRGQHPLASFGGELAGQMTLQGLAGGIPGLGKLLASPWGRRGADALYGAYSGSGENDDNRGVGGALGGALGGGLGMFGRGLQRGLGHAATGIRNADLGYLDKAGVPLTIGRIARGAGDFDPMNPSTVGDEIGKGVAGIEDRLAGLPGLDAVIGTARQRGDQAFNQTAFREIAPGVSGTGAAGLTSAKAAENAAYAKLGPVRLAVDQPFTEALGHAEQVANSLNHHSGDVQSVISDIRSQIDNGGMTGKGYQTAMQAIRKTRATLNDDVGGKAAATLTGLEQEVAALGDRQGGQIASDLADANAIHGRREIIKSAVKGPVAQGTGEMFSPKALNQASIRNTEKFGGLDKALSPDRAFYDLTHAGMKVMPNLTPDSGTAGRLLLYPLIAGAGGAGIGALAGGDNREHGAETGSGIGTGLGLLALAAGAGPYSRTGQRAIQRALLGERPEVIQRIGEFLIKRNPKYAGMFASALGRDYAYQPELTP